MKQLLVESRIKYVNDHYKILHIVLVMFEIFHNKMLEKLKFIEKDFLTLPSKF